jgi:hypothetical protein
MEKSSQIAWKIVPFRHLFPLKFVPLIEVLMYPLKAGSTATVDFSFLRLSFSAFILKPLPFPPCPTIRAQSGMSQLCSRVEL